MWLYVPNLSTSSPSAPAAAGSISESNWRFPALAASVWWRGKPSPSRTWFQRWNKVSFIRLLCGAMPEPSTADAGVDAWTASLAASRVSPTALPGGSVEASMSATCGPTPDASSCNPDAGSSLSKTSAACSRRGLTKSLEPSGYGETFASLVSRLRSDCLRRRKSARAMSGSGSSSSAWPTPAANNGERGGMTPEEREGHTLNLQDQVQGFNVSAWPTPTANDFKGRGPTLERSDGKMRGDRLDYAAEQLWYTPNVPNGGRTLSEDTSPTGMTADGIKRQVGLENQVRWWATPQARDHMPPHSPERIAAMKALGHGMRNLNDEAAMWMTPRSHEVGNYQYSRGDKTKPVETLTGQTIYSRLAQVTVKTGKPSSKERRSLNPLFVEWLMGWPPGWTLLVSTDFACSATELCRFNQRMRSALSAIALPAEAPPAQLALFG